MIVQGTKRFLDELMLKRKWLSHIGKKEYPRGLFDWYAHTMDFEGKTGIVLANNLTRYPVVLLKNEQFQIEQIPNYILETLKSEGIHEEVLQTYRSQMGMLLIDKTSDRELVQKLSYTCDMVKDCLYLLDSNACLQTKIAREAAKKRVHYNDIGYKTPAEMMLEQLNLVRQHKRLCVPLLDIEALDLKIRLEMPSQDIEVRLTVPSNIPFLLLHELILKLFDWNVKGEHKFFHAGNVVDEIRELQDIDWESGVNYEYWMPGYYRWRHTICLMERKAHQQTRAALATACRGQRPPWILNGPEAYKVYQEILKDTAHPDYEKAQLLYHRYGARKLSLREINMELKWVMEG